MIATPSCALLLLGLLFIAFAPTASAVLANIFKANKKGKLPKKRCINIGSWFQSDGPFEAEIGFVRYTGKDPRGVEGSGDIENTSFDHAFLTQRQKKKINLNMLVNKNYKYKVSLGFAELRRKFCKTGARILEITVGGQTLSNVDIFSRVGCRRAVFIEFNDVMANRKGLLNTVIHGVNTSAALATVCIGRGVAISPTNRPGPSSRPSNSPIPAPSNAPSSAPSNAPSNAPSIAPSNAPIPMASSTPTMTPIPPSSPSAAPSRTPRPNPSKTPNTTPSSSPKAKLGPAACTQPGCMNFEGYGNYVVVGNSMSYDEDRSDCRMKNSTSARFFLPPGSSITKVLLYWSATGLPGNQVQLNGQAVTASRIYYGGASGLDFYGAESDVTNLIQGAGKVTVSGIRFNPRSDYCYRNALYAAWSIVAVYSSPIMPLVRINLCSDWFKFTFPAGYYDSVVNCVDNKNTEFAKTTMVTFESDAYKGENLLINNRLEGIDLFRGRTAPNLDILSLDITRIVRVGGTSIKYTIHSYLTDTDFGKAIEGLFMPVRIVLYRI